MATLTAYLAHSYLTPADLIGKSPDALAAALSLAGDNMIGHPGWVKVGTAEVAVTLDSQDEIIVNTIAALRKAKRELLATAEAESTRLEGEIQKLLAITNEVAL